MLHAARRCDHNTALRLVLRRRGQGLYSKGNLVRVKTVAVLWAGHGGLAAAADLSLRGFDVRLQGRNEERLAALRRRGGVDVKGVHRAFVPLNSITSDVAEAVSGADLIMLVIPSIAHESYARALAPLLKPGQPVFLNPGHTGGGLHFCWELKRAGFKGEPQTCESVTLTYITRMEGETCVNIYSYTKRLAFAAFPGNNAAKLFELIKPLYPEIALSSNVLETALTNINAVFHPPGMIMNAGWIERTDGNFLFYAEGVTEAVGRVTKAVDDERLAVAAALGIPSVSFLEAFFRAGLTTRDALESGSIRRACEESAPNATIRSPSSLDHRYVHEDVGYGLVPLSAFGRLARVPTPAIDALVTLANHAVGRDFWKTGLTLEKMGLASVDKGRLSSFLENGH
jgi:opine dehydrogenase